MTPCSQRSRLDTSRQTVCTTFAVTLETIFVLAERRAFWQWIGNKHERGSYGNCVFDRPIERAMVSINSMHSFRRLTLLFCGLKCVFYVDAFDDQHAVVGFFNFSADLGS